VHGFLQSISGWWLDVQRGDDIQSQHCGNMAAMPLAK